MTPNVRRGWRKIRNLWESERQEVIDVTLSIIHFLRHSVISVARREHDTFFSVSKLPNLVNEHGIDSTSINVAGRSSSAEQKKRVKRGVKRFFFFI